jgi:hypothetical protein
VGGDSAVSVLDEAAKHRLVEMLASRRLEVDLELGLERRVRAYAERLNARLALEGDRDPYDLGNDDELAAAIMLLCETALDAEEQREDSSN